MKVASINTVADISNAPGRIMIDINKAVINNGGNVFVAYGRGECSNIKSAYKIGSSIDFISHLLKSRISDSEGLHSQKATIKLIRQLEKFSPDIIHLHNLHGHYINYPLLMQWINGTSIPIVWTLHDCWAMTGHCAHYTANNCNNWLNNSCINCFHNKNYPYSITSHSNRNYIIKQNNFTTQRNLTCVAVSKWLANNIKQSFLRNNPLEIIPNGIDTEIFKPYYHLNFNHNKFKIIGVASNWRENKNIDFFNHLISKLSDYYEITIVGKISPQIKKKLNNKIICIGKIKNPNELAKVYSSANLLINPSREETFGMTTIEALSCDIPVIVNNTTALPETITSENGFATDIDNINLVIELIKHIDQNRNFYQNKCRQHIIDNYSVSQMTNKYLNLYNDIITKQSRNI